MRCYLGDIGEIARRRKREAQSRCPNDSQPWAIENNQARAGCGDARGRHMRSNKVTPTTDEINNAAIAHAETKSRHIPAVHRLCKNDCIVEAPTLL